MVKAVAVLRGDSKVGGIVTFEQTEENQPVTVTYEIAGNSPNAKRGFHIHAFGDNTNGCTSAGPHFNPFNAEHGASENAKDKRHVGDLGNITTDASGVAKGQLTDSLIQLFGQNSIIGRSVVVHEGEDDYGLGGHDDSKTTGHAGGRAACGVIGLTTN